MQARRTFRRIAVIVVAIVILAPLAVIGLFLASFDPNSYKPQVIAAAERALHRPVSIDGRLRMSLSLVPTISATGITIANPPGYQNTNLATLRRIEAKVALLPLLRHQLNILDLVLVDPVINLEYGPTGTPDWLIGQGAPAPAGTGAGTGSASGPAAGVALQSVSIENGTITYHPPMALVPLNAGQPAALATPQPTVLHIARFTGRAASLDAPLQLAIDAQYNGTPFTVAGTTGPVSRLTGSVAGGAPWPVDLTVSGQGANLRVTGQIAHPREASGYALHLHATAPDLAPLAAYLPAADRGDLPPLQQVDLRADLGPPAGGTLPSVTNVSLTAGKSDLTAWRKGLSLRSMNITLPALDQAVDVALAGQYQGRQVGLEGKAGPVGPVIEAALGAPAPAHAVPTERFTMNVAGRVGNALFNAAGGMATPSKLAGVAMKLSATIPDLAKLSDLVGTPLPAWTDIGVSGLLTDPGGQGLANTVALNSLAISSAQAQLGGAFSLRLGPKPDLQAVIHASRIDLTALLKAMPKPAAATPGTAGAGGAAPPQASPQPKPAAAVAPSNPHLIPDTPLPFNLLRAADGNVELTVDKLTYAGADYRALTAHALLRNGVLTVRPISGELPGGPVSGTLMVDAAANPPSVRLIEQAPAFRLGPLLRLLGQPGSASATVQLYADLGGAGSTAHDIASTLNGSLGVSTVNGEIDGALLDRLLTAAGLPAGVAGAQGPVQLRCFATRIDAHAGLASIRALTLDSSRLFMTGGGTVNLATEGLNVVLRPQTDLGGGATPIPFAVTGTLAHPATGIAPPGDYAQAIAAAGQKMGGGQTLFGQITRQLGLAPRSAAPQSCASALALARMGHPGPAPTTAGLATGGGNGGGTGSGSGQAPGAVSGPQNLLQSLFH
ncbi:MULTISPECIES: AsmA family protein [Acidiphilium]|uniref:AsmA family protein n=1 Tax=Acidiphilium multivorum (strain DSM 11245 / JCM 8867 / NBRC 100883 / AIU 301) TaxID=926570 RepID=F0J510_ACIMA|nr:MULTISPECIES: AsmA family protein [Acidiphilium]MBU6357571.1 AsmA family protein [Rhodospirillales bacterium]UNC14306.1 AsmA family protein [Acidiphilium multivorum]BAJ82357.1 AsmA family protein [Acidiphilium multivorum AIU301]